MKAKVFVGAVRVNAQAGKGGDGSASFRREACVPLGGPDGGDGGRGGHVILRGSNHETSLLSLYYDPNLIAEDGVGGSGARKFGRRGKDRIVPVPCGTTVHDAETGELIGEVLEHGAELMVCRCGQGGLGNVHFKSSRNRAPQEHTLGTPGEVRTLQLELKTIADAGLLGFPNAGKSSLLTAVSAARPKIASYPFTTLNPMVGTVEYPDYARLRIADIPGIIEGAAKGVGLGTDFLKHLARARVIVYVIDMAGVDNRQPWKDYEVLHAELGEHDSGLLERPFLVLANKMDVEGAEENLKRFICETGLQPIPLVASDPADAGVAQFRQKLRELVNPAPATGWQRPAESCDIPGAPFLDMGAKQRAKKRAHPSRGARGERR